MAFMDQMIPCPLRLLGHSGARARVVILFFHRRRTTVKNQMWANALVTRSLSTHRQRSQNLRLFWTTPLRQVRPCGHWFCSLVVGRVGLCKRNISLTFTFFGKNGLLFLFWCQVSRTRCTCKWKFQPRPFNEFVNIFTAVRWMCSSCTFL